MYWNPGGALAGAIVCMIIPVMWLERSTTQVPT